jgi:hypothetical protein
LGSRAPTGRCCSARAPEAEFERSSRRLKVCRAQRANPEGCSPWRRTRHELAALDRADREESDVAEAQTTRLKDKIAGLRRQMQALRQMQQRVQDAPDQGRSTGDLWDKVYVGKVSSVRLRASVLAHQLDRLLGRRRADAEDQRRRAVRELPILSRLLGAPKRVGPRR